MTIKLVIASHKGGTGKTTTAVTVGHRLAQLGQRVLLIDLDAQGNLADYLGIEPGPGVYRLLKDREPLASVVVDAGRERLALVPGNHSTAQAAKDLIAVYGRDQRLRRAVDGSPYDWILFDTAPSLGLLQALAFVAADWLLIPTELTFASGLGVAQVLRTVATLKQEIDGMRIRLAGILPTKWDRRVGESEAQLKILAERFPKLVWLPIPTDAKVAEAPAYGSTLWEYAPGCAALAGRQIGDRLIGGYEQTVTRLLKETRR
jgi:chromosome partitioning protein